MASQEQYTNGTQGSTEEKLEFVPTSQITPMTITATSVELADSMIKKSATKRKEIRWYYAPVFLFAWVGLFFAVVYPLYFYLPEGLHIQTETDHPTSFIGERAQRILLDFEMIGPKVVGSHANEVETVNLIVREIDKVRQVMNHGLFDLEVDVQQVSGAYAHWSMINMYQGVQNVVVKLSPKNTTSQSYLLINSHFDSKPGSPGSGDDGAMVVIMLEILRVLATSTRSIFVHPIVFLFNGAEENPLQASHGFITQHKWARNCQALINLDSAGSGQREILFQSGPNHPWLMNYYRKAVNRPFATTMAEELFQSGVLPSDTDFRIFKNYGHLPGLDLAHTYNGYVYHTPFDKLDVIPLGTLQITGDHILALAQAFANAPELEDTSKHADGHTVFYDFLGLFMLYYTETVGKIINALVSVAAILIPGISLWLMARKSALTFSRVLCSFSLIFLLHLVGFVLAFGLPVLMAVIYDSDDRSMTWFTNKWLVIGLYICPSLFGLSAPTLIYFSFDRKKNQLSRPFRVQMALHSHALILAILCIVGTFMGLRTSYLLMISLLFYVCSLILNIITTMHSRGYLWMIILLISQVMPFLYFSYLIYCFLCTLMPMMGRFGSETNPDLYVSGLCALGTVLAMGFVIPTLSIFRRPKALLLSLLVITFIFAMISLTYVGFPYRARTHVGRINFLHVRRVFYNYDHSVDKNESGYYFDFQDRRMHHPIEEHVDVTELESTNDDCEEYMMCGLPLFNHRWHKARKQGMWLPSSSPVELPGTPTLKLLGKTVNQTSSTVRFEYELSGPAHMSIFLLPMEDVTVTDWSFLRELIDKPDEWEPPYHIYFSYGIDKSPLLFYFELKKTDGQYDAPLFELGISAHYVSYEHRREAGEAFIKSFPDYVHVMEWPSSYERYIY